LGLSAGVRSPTIASASAAQRTRHLHGVEHDKFLCFEVMDKFIGDWSAKTAAFAAPTHSTLAFDAGLGVPPVPSPAAPAPPLVP
jgi:hypothetical protein